MFELLVLIHKKRSDILEQTIMKDEDMIEK